MRCAEFERRWQELLDERAAPAADAALAAHAEACEACAALLAGGDVLLSGAAAWADHEPGVDLAARAVAQWRSQTPVYPRRAKRTALALATAASVLVGALALWQWQRPPVVPPAPAVIAAHRVPRPALVDEASEACAPLVAETRDSILEAMAWFPATALTEDEPRGDPAAAIASHTMPNQTASPGTAESLVALLRVLPGTSREAD